jgi:hypothetical protein
MNRLPKSFEEEVLKKHRIFYSECMERYENQEDFCVECGSVVSKYEIAGIFLETISICDDVMPFALGIRQGNIIDTIFKIIRSKYE